MASIKLDKLLNTRKAFFISSEKLATYVCMGAALKSLAAEPVKFYILGVARYGIMSNRVEESDKRSKALLASWILYSQPIQSRQLYVGSQKKLFHH